MNLGGFLTSGNHEYKENTKYKQIYRNLNEENTLGCINPHKSNNSSSDLNPFNMRSSQFEDFVSQLLGDMEYPPPAVQT